MAKTADAKTPTETDAKPVRRPRRLMIALALAGVTATVATTGGYFALGSAGAETPEADAVAATAIPVPMPVAVLGARTPTKAQDYQIVSIYGDEAILAVGSNLLRVKAGSLAPGLGTVTAIEPRANGGGSVIATEATLSTS